MNNDRCSYNTYRGLASIAALVLPLYKTIDVATWKHGQSGTKMASLRVQNQLLRGLDLNAEGIAVPAPGPLPTLLQNHPPQPSFPAYIVGYPLTGNVISVPQTIPQRPANGGSSGHPFSMLSGANLHPILFQLEPNSTNLTEIPVPVLENPATNEIEVGNNNKQLRYFSHLPRWVAFNVSGAMMELWLRLDPRTEMSDILDRINHRSTGRVPQPNAYNMRRMRFRDLINLPVFNTGRQHPTNAEVDLLAVLRREQLLLNTAMIVDLQNNRLLMPILENGSVRDYINSQLPLDYFLQCFADPVEAHIPSNRQIILIELRKRMQRLAILRNLGTDPQDYHELPTDLTPAWWHKGQPGDRKITEIDGKTHYEWIAEMNVRYPGITRSGAQRKTTRRTQAVLPPAPALPLSAPAGVAAQSPLARPATPAVAMAIDTRMLVGSGAAAFDVEPVSPWHVVNADGGFSFYVEPVHRAACAADGNEGPSRR